MYKSKIEAWDKVHVQKHLHNIVYETFRLLGDKKDITIIDVGANSGAYVDRLLSNYTVKKAVLFEPQKDLYDYMVDKYKSRPEIIVENFALSDAEYNYNLNEVSLHHHVQHVHEEDPLFNLGLSLVNYSNEPSIHKTKSFDQIRHIYDLDTIDLIKVDTEGDDFRVLKGFIETIQLLEIKPLIVFEMNWFMSQSYPEAQDIFDEFCNRTGYANTINLYERGDFFLHPPGN